MINLSKSSMVKKVPLFALIGLVIFLPRIYDLTALINTDGSTYWIGRAVNFYSSLIELDFMSTYQSSHPGVTVMWLSGFGVILGSFIEFGSVNPWGKLQELHWYAVLPVSLFTGFIVLAIGSVARYISRDLTFSVVVILILAFDPMLIAHSRYLHLDATAALLSVLSILLAFAAIFRSKNWMAIVLCGIVLGLGILTRMHVIFAVPIIVMIFFFNIFEKDELSRFSIRFNIFVKYLGVLAGVGCLTVFILWPALWIHPIEITLRLVGRVGSAMGEAHNTEVVSREPFWFMFRDFVVHQSWYFLIFGALGIAIALLRTLQKRSDILDSTILWMAFFCAFVLIGMSFFEKARTIENGFRYGFSAFVGFKVVVAYGLYEVLRLSKSFLKTGSRVKATCLMIFLCVPSIGHSLNVFSAHPYYQAVGNELFKPRYVGWGEGLEQAAKYIDGLPESESYVVVSFYPSIVRHFFRGEVISFPDLISSSAVKRPDFIILYDSRVSRGEFSEIADQFMSNNQRKPEFIASIRGREYAWVYRVDVSDVFKDFQ